MRTLTLDLAGGPGREGARTPARSDPRMAVSSFPVVGAGGAAPDAQLLARGAGSKLRSSCASPTHRYPQRRLAEAVAETAYRRRFPWSDPAMLRSHAGHRVGAVCAGAPAGRRCAGSRRRRWCVWGDTDRLVAPDLAPYVAAAIPEARLLVLRDIGHTAMMEDPRTTARAILALLEDTRTDAVTEDSGSAVAT